MAIEEAVRIWRMGPEVFDALSESLMARRIDGWRSMLGAEERRRADAFHAEKHRREYIAAHVALRMVLGRLVCREPGLLEFASENGGKPGLLPADASEAALDLRFSLSHTRRAVLIAAACGREVGVDVEWARPMDDLEAMARSVMSEVETQRWQMLPDAERLGGFYRLWTRKESYLKAIGLGLFRDLQEVTVPVGAELLDAPEAVQDRSGDGLWMVEDLEAWDGFSASACWQGDGAVRLVVEEIELAELLEN